MNILEETIEIRQAGYRVFTSERMQHENETDFFMVTPSNNIMYAWYDRFCGWQICLEYVPSCANGSGCRDNTIETQHIITTEYITQMEIANLHFARTIKAVLYADPEDFIVKHWRPLTEVTA